MQIETVKVLIERDGDIEAGSRGLVHENVAAHLAACEQEIAAEVGPPKFSIRIRGDAAAIIAENYAQCFEPAPQPSSKSAPRNGGQCE